MPKKIEEYIHILSPTRAYLSAVKIMGPIVHPLQVSKKVVVSLLMNGVEVYEYIPKTKQTIKLTLGNINDSKRYEEKKPSMEVLPPVQTITKPGVPVITPKSDIKSDETVQALHEESSVQSTQSTSDTIVDFEFKYNEDGTVDEREIPWSTYTRNQRKAIRSRINEINDSVKK